MVLKLYIHEVSPAVRAIHLTTAAMGIEIDEYIPVDLLNGEQYGEEYGKRNPAATVPSLDDDGFIINDSHVILTYLTEKYAKNDKYYPKDLKKRSKVNYCLFFDMGILFPALYNPAMNIYKLVSKQPTAEHIKAAHHACNILEKLLNGHDYVAGNDLSIGDFSLITTATSLNFLIPIDEEKYPNIIGWIERMKQLPYYHYNDDGLKKHMALLEKFRGKF